MGMFVSHQWMKEGGKVRLFKGHGGIAGGSCSPNLRMGLPNQESRTEGGWIVSTYQTITVTAILPPRFSCRGLQPMPILLAQRYIKMVLASEFYLASPI